MKYARGNYILVLLVEFIHINFIENFKDLREIRCKVNCLTLLKQTSDEYLPEVESSIISLERCRRDNRCNSCSNVCFYPDMNLVNCLNRCKEHYLQCRMSCEFLNNIKAHHDDSCLEVISLEVCGTSCSDDNDCVGSRKCCNSSCGRTCYMPSDIHTGTPPIPQINKLKERISDETFELGWTSSSNPNGPVVYHLETRAVIGPTADMINFVEWKSITNQTSSTSALIDNIRPGHWYQFRVEAINVNGSRGASISTRPQRLSKEPDPPGPPLNLKEESANVNDGKMNLKMKWELPAYSDIPVSRYKIYWNKRLKIGNTYRLHEKENKKVISSDLTEYTIKDLQSDSTYYIQVQAISNYGDIKLKGEKSSALIATHASGKISKISAPTMLFLEQKRTLPALHNVSVKQSFFHNGLLKVNISWDVPLGIPEEHRVVLEWTPDVCIAGKSMDEGVPKPISATTYSHFFSIYNLRFDCRYMVSLHVVSDDEQLGEIIKVSFSSSSCHEVQIIGTEYPSCPTHAPNIPRSPLSLKHSFVISNFNISAIIKWEEPPSDMPITNYRITWGQSDSLEHNKILSRSSNRINSDINHKTAFTKVLFKSTREFKIHNLLETTSYSIHLQALSSAGAGDVCKIHFSTPGLQHKSIAPAFQIEDFHDKRHQDYSDSTLTYSKLNANYRNTCSLKQHVSLVYILFAELLLLKLLHILFR